MKRSTCCVLDANLRHRPGDQHRVHVVRLQEIGEPGAMESVVAELLDLMLVLAWGKLVDDGGALALAFDVAVCPLDARPAAASRRRDHRRPLPHQRRRRTSDESREDDRPAPRSEPFEQLEVNLDCLPRVGDLQGSTHPDEVVLHVHHDQRGALAAQLEHDQQANIPGIDTSAFAFAGDLVDEGMGAVLDNIGGRAGLGGVTMAAAYHHGRDIFPHNPRRKVHFLEGGAVFFRPDPSRYKDAGLEPIVSKLAQQSDVLAELCREGDRRGLRIRAWTVYLHNYALGEAHPEIACANAFGDRHLTDLCPSHPRVRAYVTALTTDIASRGVASIVAESLHFHGLEHGFHHERYFIELGAFGRYLLGLCFCNHCLAVADRRGVDGKKLREEARLELERRFASAPAPEEQQLVEANVAAFAGGELGGYLQARADTVASLAAEAANAAANEGATFAFIDLSGAVKGYATGRPTGDAAPTIAWQFGIDVAAVAAACGQVEAIGYAADPERLRLDLAAYRSSVGPTNRLSVILRPMAPDCDSAANLAQKLAIAREMGAVEAGFYHYGFMRLESLDLIRSAQELR